MGGSTCGCECWGGEVDAMCVCVRVCVCVGGGVVLKQAVYSRSIFCS